MTTATRGKHASAPVATAATKTNEIFELSPEMAAVFDELSEVSLARKTAEDREKELKALILAQVPGIEDQAQNVTFALRVGNAIRGKISIRVRKGLDSKILKDSFPEAFEAAQTETLYRVLG